MKHFTQNIDCLDREAGVPGTHIVEAHGSFADQSCIECKRPYPHKLMLEAVQNKEAPHCKECNGLVKPEIVFFGEQLPGNFFKNINVPRDADLCIVAGTSLTVQPFANLPGLVPEGIPRVLINKEPTGNIGSRSDDVLLLGDCDEQVRKLADACGWSEELQRLWQAVGGKPTEIEAVEPQALSDSTIADEVEALTRDIDQSLKLSEEHEMSTRKDLSRKIESHLNGETEGKSPKGTSEASRDDETAAPDGGLRHVLPHLKGSLS